MMYTIESDETMKMTCRRMRAWGGGRMWVMGGEGGLEEPTAGGESVAPRDGDATGGLYAQRGRGACGGGLRALLSSAS